MANVGTAVAGRVLTGKGVLQGPAFAQLGTDSGLTDGGVLIGQGNDPIVATGTGIAGQVLTSNGPGSDPTFQAAPPSGGQTITGDDAVVLSPTAGNWNVFGQDAGAVSVMDTNGSVSTLRIEDRTWPTRFVVDASATVGLRGTFTTIQAAVTAASAGDTVYIRSSATPYTEDVTLKAGVNLAAFDCDSETPNVTIIGKLTYTGAGTVTISGIRLQTNGDFFLSCTGNAASVVKLKHCFFSLTDNTGIEFTSTGANNLLQIMYCTSSFSATGIALWTKSSTGEFQIFHSELYYGSATSTQSTHSAGTVRINHCNLNFPIANSGDSNFFISNSSIECNNQAVTALTLAGTQGASLHLSKVFSDGAVAISVGSGTTLRAFSSIIDSSNAAAIDGAGTINYSNLSFSSTGSTITTTTQIPRVSSNDALKVVTPGAYPYTTVPQDAVILVDSAGGARTIVPLASPTTGQKHIIKDASGNAASNNITVTPSGANIDGAASFVMNVNFGSLTIVYSGTQWHVT